MEDQLGPLSAGNEMNGLKRPISLIVKKFLHFSIFYQSFQILSRKSIYRSALGNLHIYAKCLQSLIVETINFTIGQSVHQTVTFIVRMQSM